MFKYTDVKKVSKPREKQERVVTKIRLVKYVFERRELEIEGWEIVEEKVVSPSFDFLNHRPEVVETKTLHF